VQFSIAPIRSLCISLLSALAVLLFASSALADAATEKAAKDLQTAAIQEDFLGTEYGKAVDKLQQAIDMCGADKCSASLRGQLYRDMGAMQILNKDSAGGQASFVQALTLEPTLELDVNYKTPALDALWDAAKKQLPSNPSGSDAGAPNNPPPGNTDTGDFTHEAPEEQAVRTPVPIYVEYNANEELTKVTLKYKGQGMTSFKPVDLQKMGKGWGGQIPCADVTIGSMQYYLQGLNAAGDVAATMGTSTKPFRVTIKQTIEGEAPHLPGVAAPKQCQEVGDCPPGFPGCTKEIPASEKKSEGEECEDDAECKSNDCNHHTCTAPTEGDEGGSGQKYPRVWIGALGGIDFVLLGSANDVCKLADPQATPLNSAGYYCANPDGSDYPNRTDRTQNQNLRLGKSDQVQGGFLPGTIRAMLSVDYALNMNMMVGARLGYVIGTFPGQAASTDGKAFAPIYGEVRGTYLIGQNAVIKPGITPYAFVGAGVQEFTAHVDVTVVETGTAGTKTVQAWGIGGPIFVDLGGGARYLLSPKAALFGAMKLSAAFGGAGLMPALSPELGVQLGF
jgi:hypothetical protein